MCTVLFGVATLELFGNRTVERVIFVVVTWLVGLAAMSMLWRRSSSEFFDWRHYVRQKAPR